MKHKALLFDLDGTLIDPKVGILGSLRHTLSKMGRISPPDEVLETFIGPPLRRIFEDLLATTERDFVEQAVQLYRDRYNDIGMYEAHVYDGIPAMLQLAKETSSKLFIATSKSRPSAERVLQHFGLRSYFRAVYGAELDGKFENKVDLIRHLLRVEGLDGRDAVMIGDRGVDMIAARGNHVESLGTLWGYGSAEELLRAGADRLCKAPTQLVAGLHIDIVDAASLSDIETARGLFQEYAAELKVDLCFQNFASELENLATMYAAPKGCLFLARENDTAIGCVAVRPFQDHACEMKRLYLRPDARKTGAGRNLAVKAIQRARSMGYRKMVLDTLETLHAARELYRTLGFKEVSPYYDNPLSGVVYMELDL